jgi:hypothetical protein
MDDVVYAFVDEMGHALNAAGIAMEIDVDHSSIPDCRL